MEVQVECCIERTMLMMIVRCVRGKEAYYDEIQMYMTVLHTPEDLLERDICTEMKEISMDEEINNLIKRYLGGFLCI